MVLVAAAVVEARATMGRVSLEEAAALVRPRDTVLTGFAAGQAAGLLEALGTRRDLEDVVIYGGLLIRPYDLLQNPGVRFVSGFFGPIERMARAAGARVEYLAADFHGLEQLALELRPRVVLAVTSPPDADGWLSFGLHAGVGIAVPLLRSKLDLEIALQGTRGLISDFTFRRVTQVM